MYPMTRCRNCARNPIAASETPTCSQNHEGAEMAINAPNSNIHQFSEEESCLSVLFSLPVPRSPAATQVHSASQYELRGKSLVQNKESSSKTDGI